MVIIYIVTFNPNSEHANLMPTDGFPQTITVAHDLTDAEQKMFEQLELDEYLLDADGHPPEVQTASGCWYYTSNYGTYKIEKIVL